MYYVYMLRCEDNSIYTGITNDVENRMHEHFTKGKNCAKYTLRHRPIKLEALWQTLDKSLASKLEYHIKKDLSKVEKEFLIKNKVGLDNLFNINVIDYSKYERLKVNEINVK